ncbi:putative cyclin-dependent kinase [Cyclospora cayetanensis]|uniref:Cyclin-dependent kinases regulatory subunit n=1 Tax=Cyclospora cayetanensis TaxID=88456 RepID=A0A1D3D2A6_9EIME|nr:putative cyclin-dependent kinase [Cyclospora cayetanensis]
MDAVPSTRMPSGCPAISEGPRNFLDSLPSPIAPAPPGSLGYVITKEHVEEMRRMERLCEAKEEQLHREYKPIFLPVDAYLSKEINCELINVDIRSYPWKNTPFGDVYYSPRYSDDRYVYRHVLLTNGVRKEAERVAATVPGGGEGPLPFDIAVEECVWGLLTEEVFVHYLGIVLSSGWSHFMLFNKQFKELILRRPKEAEAPTTGEEATRIRDGAPGPNDEIDSDSGDDEGQRAAIAALRRTGRLLQGRPVQQGPLEAEIKLEEQIQQQPDPPSAASGHGCCGEAPPRNANGPSPAVPPKRRPPQAPPSAATLEMHHTGSAEKENVAEITHAGAANIPTKEDASKAANGAASAVDLEKENPSRAGGLKAAAPARLPSDTAQVSDSVRLQVRRRTALGHRAALHSATAPLQLPKGGRGDGVQDAAKAAAKPRGGRTGVRRKDPTLQPRGGAEAAQKTAFGDLNAEEDNSENASTGSLVALSNGAAARKAAVMSAGEISRPLPKSGIRRGLAAEAAKADADAVRTSGRLEEKAANARGLAAKRRLEGGTAAPELPRGRKRRG